MLIYNQTFDIYHCAFRILFSLSVLPEKEYPLGFIRLIDFYVLFPHMVSKVRLPAKYKSLKNKLKGKQNSYNDIPSPKRLFNDLYNIQIQCVNFLSSLSLIDREKVIEKKILKSNTDFPSDVADLIKHEISTNENLIQIINSLSEIPYNGTNGLKSRTGLMEYRYDVD